MSVGGFRLAPKVGRLKRLTGTLTVPFVFAPKSSTTLIWNTVPSTGHAASAGTPPKSHLLTCLLQEASQLEHLHLRMPTSCKTSLLVVPSRASSFTWSTHPCQLALQIARKR